MADVRVDVCYRNPAWVTNRVIVQNSGRTLWSARFAMSRCDAQERAKPALLAAGALRVFVDPTVAQYLVVEFMPVLVRRIVCSAIHEGGVLVEVTVGSSGDARDPTVSAFGQREPARGP